MKLKEVLPDMELLQTLRVPILMYTCNKKKKDPKNPKKKITYKSTTMCSINNWSSIHWSAKSLIKNKYKDLLKKWYISNEKLPENIFFVWQPISVDKRRKDALNLA